MNRLPTLVLVSAAWACSSSSSGDSADTYCSRSKGPLTAAEAAGVTDAEQCPPGACEYSAGGSAPAQEIPPLTGVSRSSVGGNNNSATIAAGYVCGGGANGSS
jgi:hypothetical protein